MKKIVIIIIIAVGFIRRVIKIIPFGAFALLLVSRICVFIFDMFFLITGSVIAACIGNGELKHYWQENAIIDDTKLGVSGKYILNALLRDKSTPPELQIGHRLHTISDMMGRVKLTRSGRWWDEIFLNTIERDHTKKAVKLCNAALIKRIKELGLNE